MSQSERCPFVLCFLPPGELKISSLRTNISVWVQRGFGAIFLCRGRGGVTEGGQYGPRGSQGVQSALTAGAVGRGGVSGRNFSNQTQFSVFFGWKKRGGQVVRQKRFFFFFIALISISKVADLWSENVFWQLVSDKFPNKIQMWQDNLNAAVQTDLTTLNFFSDASQLNWLQNMDKKHSKADSYWNCLSSSMVIVFFLI